MNKKVLALRQIFNCDVNLEVPCFGMATVRAVQGDDEDSYFLILLRSRYFSDRRFDAAAPLSW
jgi:hypothetical protein